MSRISGPGQFPVVPTGTQRLTTPSGTQGPTTPAPQQTNSSNPNTPNQSTALVSLVKPTTQLVPVSKPTTALQSTTTPAPTAQTPRRGGLLDVLI